jgi:hypothetical protein
VLYEERLQGEYGRLLREASAHFEGKSAPHRLRDLADVQDLISVLSLPAEFAERLNESVHSEYRRLWQSVQGAQRN